MSNKEIEKTIEKTSFTMEMEGFVLTSEEKNNLRKVLSGEITYADQLQKYIDDAKRIGELANAKP